MSSPSLLRLLSSFTLLNLFSLTPLPTRAFWSNGTWTPPTACSSATTYLSANASGLTPFAGLRYDNRTSTIRTDPSSEWIFSATLDYPGENSNGPRYADVQFWLDTSATIPPDTENTTVVPYDACVIVLPGGHDALDDGRCFDAVCLDAMTDAYAAAARQVVRQRAQGNGAYESTEDACETVRSIAVPEACRSFLSRDGDDDDKNWGAILSTTLGAKDFSTRTCPNTTNPLPTVPIPLLGTGYGPDKPDSFAAYDSRIRRSIPFVIALWGNSTTLEALDMDESKRNQEFGEARVGCVRPSVIREGSRVPGEERSAAGRAAGRPMIMAGWAWGVALGVGMVGGVLF
ncbi:MAG: hypothetical protein M1817_006175 [Caeruleum heppii]|nr:MAG: hypothetical protein M1817_006175 [Caeruleum heppii]